MRYFFALILIFLYIFPLNIPKAHLDTFYLMSFCGIAYVLIWRRCKIRGALYDYLKLAVIVICLSIVPLIINQYFDAEVPKVGIKLILDIFSAIFVVESIKTLLGKFQFKTLLKLIVDASFLQALISLVLFFNPILQSSVINLISVDQGDLLKGFGAFRLIALSKTQYANMACLYGISIMCMVCIKSCGVKFSFLYFIKLIFIIIAGILSARSFFLLLLFALALYEYYDYREKGKWNLMPIFTLITVVIIVCALIIVWLENSEYSYTLQWAFEWYYNLRDNGTLETKSTDSLSNMYVFKESWKTFIFGDGQLLDSDGLFHMHTDVGLLRAYYAWGFFGAVIYYYIIYRYYKIAYNATSNIFYRGLFTCIICWVAFYQIKEFWQMSLVWPLFLCTLSLRQQSKNEASNCKNINSFS